MKKRNALLLAAAVAVALLPALAHAADKDSTVKGEILDMGCYMTHDGQGAEHAGCAVKCVKGGQPMGLKGADGAVYLLLADHGDSSAFEKAKDLAGKNVEVSGEVASKDGMKAITVHAVKAL
jgi:hypothetical protein